MLYQDSNVWFCVQFSQWSQICLFHLTEMKSKLNLTANFQVLGNVSTKHEYYNSSLVCPQLRNVFPLNLVHKDGLDPPETFWAAAHRSVRTTADSFTSKAPCYWCRTPQDVCCRGNVSHQRCCDKIVAIVKWPDPENDECERKLLRRGNQPFFNHCEAECQWMWWLHFWRSPHCRESANRSIFNRPLQWRPSGLLNLYHIHRFIQYTEPSFCIMLNCELWEPCRAM